MRIIWRETKNGHALSFYANEIKYSFAIVFALLYCTCLTFSTWSLDFSHSCYLFGLSHTLVLCLGTFHNCFSYIISNSTTIKLSVMDLQMKFHCMMELHQCLRLISINVCH